MPSNVIRAYHYKADTEVLEITFVSGNRYRYLHVPPEIFEDMQASFSKGEYFNRHIRPRFACEKLPGDTEGPPR
jgi:hypothetical protein